MRIALYHHVIPPWSFWSVFPELAKKHYIKAFEPVEDRWSEAASYDKINLERKFPFEVVKIRTSRLTGILTHLMSERGVSYVINRLFGFNVDNVGADLYRKLLQGKFDIIFTNESFWLGNFICAYAAKKCVTKLVVKQSQNQACLYIPLSPKKYVLRNVDKFIVETVQQLNVLLNEGVPRRKVAIIPKPIDTYRFRPGLSQNLREEIGLEKKDQVILYVGRITKQKGLKYLIEAMVHISNQIPDSKLLVIGSGSDAWLRTVVSKFKIKKNVIFYGPMSWFDIHLAYSTAAVFVLPSLNEQSPTVLIEAMASGIPIVATRVGGVPEMVLENKNAILVKPKDSISLSKAIIKILTDKKLAKTMSQEGRRIAELKHSIERVAEIYEQIFNDFISK